MRQSGTTIHYRAPLFRFGEFRRVAGAGLTERVSFADQYIVVFPKSCGEIRLNGGEPVVGTPAVSVLYNRGTAYTCRMYPGERERTNFVELDRALLLDILEPGDPGAADRGDRVFLAPRAPISSGAYLLQLAAERRCREAETDGLWIENAVYDALSRVLAPEAARAGRGGRSATGPTPEQRDYAKWAEAFIAERFHTSLTVSAISARVGLSPFHMCRVFKACTGVTLHEYRSRVRLRFAALELAEGRDDLASIARRLGYASQAHFTTSFRRAYSVTPGDFRARLRRGGGSLKAVVNARI